MSWIVSFGQVIDSLYSMVFSEYVDIWSTNDGTRSYDVTSLQGFEADSPYLEINGLV